MRRLCHGCGVETAADAAGTEDGWCVDCTTFYPPDLRKCVMDPFDYMLRLRTGELIRFEHAEIHGAWLYIFPFGALPEHGVLFPDVPKWGALHEPNFERGLTVRIADIAWICDAPRGS